MTSKQVEAILKEVMRITRFGWSIGKREVYEITSEGLKHRLWLESSSYSTDEIGTVDTLPLFTYHEPGVFRYSHSIVFGRNYYEFDELGMEVETQRLAADFLEHGAPFLRCQYTLLQLERAHLDRRLLSTDRLSDAIAIKLLTNRSQEVPMLLKALDAAMARRPNDTYNPWARRLMEAFDRSPDDAVALLHQTMAENIEKMKLSPKVTPASESPLLR